MPNRKDRVALIEALQTARKGSTVLAYITSTRPGLEAQMGMDVIPVFGRHLRALKGDAANRTIDLFIHSYGGDSTVPWRLVSLIREYCKTFNVLVPHHAFSAATLTAMGADEVVMHPMGNLGPIDPTANHELNPENPGQPGKTLGVSVEDVASYIDLVKHDVGIGHEDELIQAFLALAEKVHPLALGNVKRATSQSRMMGEKLLRLRDGASRMGEHEISELIDKLTSQLYFHGHPISRKEARNDLRMSFVVDAPDVVATAMWELYSAYSEDMSLTEPWDAVALMEANAPLKSPAINADPILAVADLGPYPVVYVESAERTDVTKVAYRTTVARQWTGDTNVNILRTRSSWEEET
jgi:hypothetical protein